MTVAKADTTYEARFESYRALMPHRVRKILLVSTAYDAFVLEEDGPLGEKIWDQYVEMRLTMIPRLRRASSSSEALAIIESETVDLVLLMTRIADTDPVELSAQVKRLRPDLPVVLIVSDPSELRSLPSPRERGGIDRVFLWNNDPQLFLAIIKLVEDRLNVDHDTRAGGVGVILLVEDSVAHYSSFLSALYRSVVELTRSLMAQGLNSLHRQLRLRLRAKVLLAETYEEAVELFERYKPHLLGVVSDVRFWRDGEPNPDAGFELARRIRSERSDLPILLHSAEREGKVEVARSLGATFLDKNSPALLDDLNGFLSEYMGFGDFVFRTPDGTEVGRARTIDDLCERLKDVPAESIRWHAEKNHFSNWLVARAQIRIASRLKPKRITEFSGPEEIRRFLIDAIEDVQSDTRSDVVSHFSSSHLPHHDAFMHLGEGSMGGKGRGIAFLRYVLSRSKLAARYPSVRIDVPQTVVIGADEFRRFLDDNCLRRVALAARSTEELIPRFLDAPIHQGLVESLATFVEGVQVPLAVRSSSLLEDSHLQPFAGLYATVMLPNSATEPRQRLAELLTAVKLVWLSTFNENSRAYFRSTAHRLEDEQMAVVIQRMVGRAHGSHFYPTYSGVAQSFNFYPVSHMTASDGVAEVALGLGKTVVEGGASLRFCPAYPDVFPQFPRPADWLRSSQKEFHALRLDGPPKGWTSDPDATLGLCELALAEQHGELRHVASTFSPDDQVIREGLGGSGARIVNFAPVLKQRSLPLAELLQDLLRTCQKAFGCPVEIEFAGNLGEESRPSLSLLQVRPFISSGRREKVAISEEDVREAWCSSKMSLGNGVRADIRDVLFVRRDSFDRARSKAIAEEIGAFNRDMVSEGRGYVLIGFGRWGSADPWLGIGVTWAQISGVTALVETGLPGFRVDPSQGTHFFHNITSLGVGYLSVPGGSLGGALDWDWLESFEPAGQTEHLRHLRFDSPIELKMDGRTGQAVILPP